MCNKLILINYKWLLIYNLQMLLFEEQMPCLWWDRCGLHVCYFITTSSLRACLHIVYTFGVTVFLKYWTAFLCMSSSTSCVFFLLPHSIIFDGLAKYSTLVIIELPNKESSNLFCYCTHLGKGGAIKAWSWGLIWSKHSKCPLHLIFQYFQ